MKILIVHNKYQQAGGEDAVVDSENNLLSNKQQLVIRYGPNNKNINGFVKKIGTIVSVHYSLISRDKFHNELRLVKPDVVHVHNFFPVLTPSIYDACIDASVPVVQTLHNYRTICPGALLMRKGKTCEKCVLGSPYQSVLYGCYRTSRVGTFAVAHMVDFHRKRDTWNIKVNRFIALTKFAKAKFVEAGFDPDKISVKPNFVADPVNEDEGLHKEDKALFVGRISQEKGVDVMLSAWEGIKYPLAVAGDGPKLASLKNKSKAGGVCFLGNQSTEQIHKLMSTARFLVMPSIWYEGFPMVLVEAFAHGLPVICSRLGGMAEIVDDGVTGLHFEAGDADDLIKKVNWMTSHPEECERMGKNARLEYEEKYTPEKNYKILMDIYRQAIASNKTVDCGQ